MKIGRMLALIGLLVIAISSCNLWNRIFRPMEIAIENAIGSIDRSMATLEGASNTWVNALQETREALIEAGQSMLANDVDRLIGVAAATTGGELMCLVDFTRARMIETLKQIREALSNRQSTIAALPPAICKWEPDFVNLNLPPVQRPALEFWGYDLDHKTAEGTGLKLYLVKKRLGVIPLAIRPDPEEVAGLPLRVLTTAAGRVVEYSRLGPMLTETWEDVTQHLTTSTHYKGVVDLSGSGVRVDDPKADRLVLRWGVETLSEIAIIHPTPPQVRIVRVAFSSTFKWTPPKVAGDPDFDGKCDIRAEARVERHPTDSRKLVVRLYMQAAEPESDWTRAEGWSSANDQAYLAYTAPAGFEIEGVTSPAVFRDTFAFNDRDHEDDVFVVAEIPRLIDTLARSLSAALPMSYEQAYSLAASWFDFTANGLVRQWRFVGDTVGGEAGTRTHVEVTLNDVSVRIKENR